jgi:hypothetical protein
MVTQRSKTPVPPLLSAASQIAHHWTPTKSAMTPRLAMARESHASVHRVAFSVLGGPIQRKNDAVPLPRNDAVEILPRGLRGPRPPGLGSRSRARSTATICAVVSYFAPGSFDPVRINGKTMYWRPGPSPFGVEKHAVVR